MKYIKKFENSNKHIKNGDYAIFKPDDFDSNIIEFAHNNIGEVIKIDNGIYHDKFFIIVKYDNIDKLPSYSKYRFKYDNEIKCYTKVYSSIDLEYFSENKEDVELYIESKKYNL